MMGEGDESRNPPLRGNRYRVDMLLGKGGMARVYKAWDLRLDRPIALKEMILPPQGDPKLLAQIHEQFRQEAHTVGRLHHPNVVNVSDFFADGEHLYLVMDYVQGESLRARIQRLGPLATAEVVSLALELLEALAYIHKHGVLHRDINPANIIVRSDGTPILVDFGLTKSLNPHYGETKTIVRGVGTEGYAPPEQYSGAAGHTDVRSDIYSLGATLYHALTGVAPPSATDRMAKPDLLQPIQIRRPDVTSALDAAIRQAMSLSINQRFVDATAMRVALSAGETLEKPRRNLSRWLLIILSLLLFTFLLSWSLLQNRESTTFIAMPQSRTPILSTRSVTPIVEAALTLEAPDTATPETLSTEPLSITIAQAPSPTPSLILSPTTAMTSQQLPAITTPLPGGSTRIHSVDEAVLVYISQGSFVQGLSEKQIDRLMERCGGCSREAFSASVPQRTVYIDAFWIYQSEVTNGMYNRCVAANICSPPARFESNTRNDYWLNPAYAAYPVIHVTWADAYTYCRWSGGRLPTNAEWEKAARGTDGRLFPWGDEWPSPDLANVNQPETGDTTAVGSYPGGASPYGVYEMAGNVWEWVSDWYELTYYASAPSRNPPGPPSSVSGERVGRGGNWYWQEGYASAGYRDYWIPTESASGVGFRCVIDD